MPYAIVQYPALVASIRRRDALIGLADVLLNLRPGEGFLYDFKGGGYATAGLRRHDSRSVRALGPKTKGRTCGRRQAAVLGPRAAPAGVARRERLRPRGST